jgi:hypothetical protein
MWWWWLRERGCGGGGLEREQVALAQEQSHTIKDDKNDVIHALFFVPGQWGARVLALPEFPGSPKAIIIRRGAFIRTLGG